jgi:hypothetical protein
VPYSLDRRLARTTAAAVQAGANVARAVSGKASAEARRGRRVTPLRPRVAPMGESLR